MAIRVLIALFFVLLPLLISTCTGGVLHNRELDPERLLKHVEVMVSYGPHPPGSEAQRQVAAYIESQLREAGLELESQTFIAATPVGRVEMKNIIGKIPAARAEVILLASHYDSKYFKNFSFVGANDGGSSSAVVLELARLLATNNPTDFSLRFVFFDGEEAFRTWTSLDSLYGSRHMVEALKRSGQLKQVRAMILLDLVGGENLVLRKDRNSEDWLNRIIWQKASELGYQSMFDPLGYVDAVDDHIPFSAEGVPVVDLIDLAYPYWHTAEDTLDKISPLSMQRVGRVVLESLPEISARLSKQKGSVP